MIKSFSKTKNVDDFMNMMNKKQKKYKQIKHPINNFIRDLENNLDNFPIVSNKTVETFEKIPRVSFNEKENKYSKRICIC